jgi:hypothetical protein
VDIPLVTFPLFRGIDRPMPNPICFLWLFFDFGKGSQPEKFISPHLINIIPSRHVETVT